MEDQADSADITSDESLVLLARAGDRSAFAELWQRHARSGMRVARQFTSSIDADDLVSEAYARIYQRVLAGGGPEGAFRPYLYTTIRNLASRWGQSRHDVNVDDMGEFEDPELSDDPATVALDRTLTVRAFSSLPERWQSVLWYTEVEGMDPHEVAPILGISANSVAALSYRAREGLRKAWLQAHVSDATASGECQWTIGRLGDYARKGLTPRDHQRVSDHLATCAKCTIISEEVDEVGSRLALVMIPLLLGGAVGGSLLASLSAPSAAVAATAAPALPPAFGSMGAAGSVAAPAVTAGLTAPALSAPLVGTIAVALAVSGGLAVSYAAPAAPPSATSSIAEPYVAPNPSAAAPGADGNIPVPTAAPLTAPLGSTVNDVVGGVGNNVDGLVNNLTDPVNTLIPGLNVGPGAVPDHTAPGGVVGSALDLGGKGMPGATVSVQAANTVYATTTVTAQGTWAVHLTALPDGVGPITVKQTLVSLLGINLVSVPLSVLSNSLGVTVDILGL
ncbi:sigma-70 family RNA polymerase sigma factor [Glaciihabitans sp. UYNi722]|uniref:sigma-70 family RNA polymerase sigma factor n=1 Tax=Glaciihabitans sp. UYNi722 TaxID=3156344 RepID=UPI003398D1BA